MALSLYLDECAYQKELVRRLQAAGHHVVHAIEAGLRGEKDDTRHLAYAASKSMILLTKNPSHFVIAHLNWLETGRSHSGIILIHQDNDPSKDMNPAEIVRAMGRVEESLQGGHLVMANRSISLNDYRY